MSGGKPKTPGTLRGMRRRKSGVARSTLTTPILKQVDDSTWARVDAVELEEEDPEEVNAHKLPVFSSRALPASPRTAPPSERPFSMNDATNTKWWTFRQPSPFVSARKTPTPSPAPSRERDENDIPTSGTAVDDLASPRVNSRVRRPARSARTMRYSLEEPRDHRHSVLGPRLGCLVPTVRVSRAEEAARLGTRC
mmetsp:Transcript_10614/g.46001  ORF Transcript_10614/g.46001 Transcript_10614/m.46001 type:complete len:195 (-) Transcript_10614:626-1210(-)